MAVLCIYLLFCYTATIGMAATASAQVNKNNHQKKKYVIEVEDHQQAMRYANPVIDLEDSVRRGINNPLANPGLLMNKMNGGLLNYPTPVQNNNFRNNEYMSYHGSMPTMLSASQDQIPSILGVGTHDSKGLTSTPEQNEQASKEALVARHPASIPTISDMLPYPTKLFHNLFPSTKMTISGVDLNDLSENIAQNGAVRSPHEFQRESSGKFNLLNKNEPTNGKETSPHLDSMVRELLQKQHLQKQLLERQLSQKQDTQNQVRQKQLFERQLQQKQLLQKQLLQKQQLQKQLLQRQLLQQSSQSKIKINKENLISDEINSRMKPQLENINPLTGLPENLEDRTYGSVSSVTSLSDTPPPSMPSSVTVTTGDTSLPTRSIHSEVNPTQKQIIPSTVLPSASSSDDSNQGPAQLGENFSSLKSFLEADNILREKLNKVDDESTDASPISEKSGTEGLNLGPDFDVSVGEDPGKTSNPSKRASLLHHGVKRLYKSL